MNSDDPLAFFITWTVYGTHLRGDERGWRSRSKGNQPPRPRLKQWYRERLKFDVILLSPEQRLIVEHECRRHCERRGWPLWAVNARSNHVHAVVTATSRTGKIVRDQLKANATRALREQWSVFRDRPVWTVGGDWECINSDEDLETVCTYVCDAQGRKARDQS